MHYPASCCRRKTPSFRGSIIHLVLGFSGGKGGGVIFSSKNLKGVPLKNNFVSNRDWREIKPLNNNVTFKNFQKPEFAIVKRQKSIFDDSYQVG